MNESHIHVKSIHCNVKNVSRKKGHSSVAAAAYHSRKKLRDLRTGSTHRYTRKENDVFHCGILAPTDAPEWVNDREDLWNKVEAAEKRSDSRTAKTIETAITREIPQDQWISLIEEYAAPYLEKGLVVDYAIHEDGTNHNPHCHLLISTRPLTGEGFDKHKLTDLDKKSFVNTAREDWTKISNKFLEAAGSHVRVDHRSLKARGIKRAPERHRGKRTQEYDQEDIALQQQEHQPMRQRPTTKDCKDYPNLTKREDWPPIHRQPSPDMEYHEKLELKKYWKNHDQENRTGQDENEFSAWMRDIDQKQKSQQEYHDEEMPKLHRELLEDEARQLPQTEAEQTRLNEAQRTGNLDEVKRVEAKILDERVAYVEQKNWEKMVEEQDREFKDKNQIPEDNQVNQTEKLLIEAKAQSEADLYRQRGNFENKFEKIYTDPEKGQEKFNKIVEKRGEKRALEIVENNSWAIGLTKDSIRRVFERTRLEREQAKESRNEFRETYNRLKELDNKHTYDANALERYRKDQEEEQERER